MREVRREFVSFMKDFDSRLSDLGIGLTEYPVDHVCYRVDTKQAFGEYFEIFKGASVLYTKKFFHGRNFLLFVLREPFSFKNISIAYLEFAEPGGSDDYNRGFQHLELHTNRNIREIVKDGKKLEELLFKGKHGDEEYLKWSDKIALKITSKPIITKSLLEDDPEIVLVN